MSYGRITYTMEYAIIDDFYILQSDKNVTLMLVGMIFPFVQNNY